MNKNQNQEKNQSETFVCHKILKSGLGIVSFFRFLDFTISIKGFLQVKM